jgi:hypothetical protein
MDDGDYPVTSLVDAAVGDEQAWHEIVDRYSPLPANVIRRSRLERGPERRSDPGDARVLVFTASSLSLELEVMPGRVVGQIVPPGPGEIWVEAADGVTFHVEADDIGFFDLPGLPRGPVRLRCDTPTGRLVTDWVRL